ncbi:hypothetical protein TGRH88_066520 [Toxoplasma gondii]|uniref:Uncharacterized protein n=1 Tax=Toxoplasma gondii TaxID=5811 RepID=A0A7J6JV26_TOXGO|nr:hypothetical protein TGRH88_066520 [Toxoplasma gondii]
MVPCRGASKNDLMLPTADEGALLVWCVSRNNWRAIAMARESTAGGGRWRFCFYAFAVTTWRVGQEEKEQRKRWICRGYRAVRCEAGGGVGRFVVCVGCGRRQIDNRCLRSVASECAPKWPGQGFRKTGTSARRAIAMARESTAGGGRWRFCFYAFAVTTWRVGQEEKVSHPRGGVPACGVMWLLEFE